ncbi:hypothetical protein D1816_02540 [Aquimarina sp. AD10]|uniref:hypothetical protein n=1 Tax=Aquimarina sp. AD10 TaxID=1714849 RepID=UPI000E4B22EE|nr:hypothetical protein [Aquimarina sp. AD10]AXT59271.1 hypothetical protein D1816_02540 [Aquimarina sp. AD10]RKM92443.1 hypothetical protein D7033_20980 [Aquimarina sp. AD10]
MKIDLNKTPRKIKLWIYGLCGLIFIALNFGFGAKLQIGLTENLQKLTDYFFGISTNMLDYLALATIPLFGMIYNSTREYFKIKELITDILTVIFFVIIVFGIGLFIMVFSAKHSSPLIPNSLKAEPFDLYSTILVGIGILTPYLIVKLTKK